MTDEPIAGIGDNNPPPDPWLERLREENAALLEKQVDLELKAAKLPKEVNSDADVAAINAWVVDSRALARSTEGLRQDAKKPILAMTRTLDGFFNSIRDGLTSRADDMARRCVPYLKRKREIEEAAARERERVAREASEKAAAEAKALRDAQEAAQRKAREAQEAAEAAAKAGDAAAAAAAQEQAKAAGSAITANAVAADEAEQLAETAGRAADDAATLADGGYGLAKTSGGGGNTTLVEVWSATVTNRADLLASLGPLAPYLAPGAITDALARAAKDDRPEVPGVTYTVDHTAQTRATKRK